MPAEWRSYVSRLPESLLSLGVAPTSSAGDRKRVQLVNAAALLTAIVTLGSVPFMTVTDWWLGMAPLCSLTAMLGVLWLNARGRAWQAGLLLCTTELLVIDVLTVRHAFPGGDHLHLLVLTLLPFLIMGGKHTRSAILLALLAFGSFAIAILIYDYREFFLKSQNARAWFLSTHLTLAVLFGLLASFARQILLVAEHQVEQERQRTNSVLHSIFSPEVASKLKLGVAERARRHGDASILFCRICDLDVLVGPQRAEHQLSILREVFERFDQLCVEHGVEKIKSFGEHYMVAAGIPTARSDHAEVLAELAIALRAGVNEIATQRGVGLHVRIGINSGPLVSAVLGRERLSYDLWGDTVNTAQRMETVASDDEIRVSAIAFAKLNHVYRCAMCEVVEIKGKLPMRTYRLETKILPVERSQ